MNSLKELIAMIFAIDTNSCTCCVGNAEALIPYGAIANVHYYTRVLLVQGKVSRQSVIRECCYNALHNSNPFHSINLLWVGMGLPVFAL